MWKLWIRLGAPAKRAVEKFPVSSFHLEMAASSTRAGELGLESQEEGLLAEKSESPRFCSVYLQGTTSKCLLGFIMLWVSGTSIAILVLKLNWHIAMRCLPGCGLGFLLVLMASYDMKHRESKHIESKKLPGWTVLAVPHFLWLILLSVFEMTWQAFTVEVVGTALGCFGLYSWMADESGRNDRHNRWRFAGWMLQFSGLLVMWLGPLLCLVQITWQVAVCSLPGICLVLLLAFAAWTEGVPRDIDVKPFILFALALLNFMALPLSGLWQWFTGMELAAFLCLCIPLCNWIWFGNSMDEDGKEFLKFLVGLGLVICVFSFGAFAWRTKLSCNQVGPWCHCWPWVLFVPFGLVCIYCAVEGVFLLWYRDKIQASRAAMRTRIIIIGTLALALPLSGMWQWFTGMELAAYSSLCIPLCNWIWFGDSMDEEENKILVGFGVVMCALYFGAFAWATKLSCNLIGPWCRSHCWPWALFVPFGLYSIYCAVEGVFLLWYRDKVRATRAAMLTRIILIGTLAVAPVLLATDVESWQEGVEAPSMNPMEYFDVSMENWTHPDIEVKRHQLHWLQMPQPIWPSSDDLANTPSRRTAFWLSYMFFKFVLAAAMAFLVLKCHCSSSKQRRGGADSQDTMEMEPLTEQEEVQRENFDDRHRSVIFFVIFPIYLTLVVKISCTAAHFGQLTAKTGLAL